MTGPCFSCRPWFGQCARCAWCQLSIAAAGVSHSPRYTLAPAGRATAASLVARRQNIERMDCADISARYVSTGDEDENEDDDGEEEEEEEGDEEEEEGDAEEAAEGADAPVNGELKPLQHPYPSSKPPPSRSSSKKYICKAVTRRRSSTAHCCYSPFLPHER